MERTWMVIFAKNAKKESIYHTTTKKDLALALTVLLAIIHQFRALTGARHVQSDLTKAAMVNLLVTFVKRVVTAMLKQQHLALTVQKGTINQIQVRAIAFHVQSDFVRTKLVKRNVTHVKDKEL